MAQNGGAPCGHGRHVGIIPLRHGQGIATKHLVPARRQLFPVPVHAVIRPGGRVVEIVDGADPVVRPVRHWLGGAAVLLDTQQHLHPAPVRLPQPLQPGAVVRQVLRQHAARVVRHRGVAVAGGTKVTDPGGKGCRGHGLQRIPTVAEIGVGVDGALLRRKAHCIRSCLTLWSMTWRFSSSAVTSSTVMPIWTISTITW